MKKAFNDLFSTRKREQDITAEEFGLYMKEKFPYLTMLDKLSLEEIIKLTDIINGLWTEIHMLRLL